MEKLARDTFSSQETFTLQDLLKANYDNQLQAQQLHRAAGDNLNECTYSLGPISQPVYACLTCIEQKLKDANILSSSITSSSSNGNNDNSKRDLKISHINEIDSQDKFDIILPYLSGICLGCSMNCHLNHNIIELWEKRDFQCDCGTLRMPKINENGQIVQMKCELDFSFSGKAENINRNNKYNHNFLGKYCYCKREYDPSEHTMHQCSKCQDWFHESCIIREYVRMNKNGHINVAKETTQEKEQQLSTNEKEKEKEKDSEKDKEKEKNTDNVTENVKEKGNEEEKEKEKEKSEETSNNSNDNSNGSAKATDTEISDAKNSEISDVQGLNGNKDGTCDTGMINNMSLRNIILPNEEILIDDLICKDCALQTPFLAFFSWNNKHDKQQQPQQTKHEVYKENKENKASIENKPHEPNKKGSENGDGGDDCDDDFAEPPRKRRRVVVTNDPNNGNVSNNDNVSNGNNSNVNNEKNKNKNKNKNEMNPVNESKQDCTNLKIFEMVSNMTNDEIKAMIVGGLWLEKGWIDNLCNCQSCKKYYKDNGLNYLFCKKENNDNDITAANGSLKVMSISDINRTEIDDNEELNPQFSEDYMTKEIVSKMPRQTTIDALTKVNQVTQNIRNKFRQYMQNNPDKKVIDVDDIYSMLNSNNSNSNRSKYKSKFGEKRKLRRLNRK